MYYIIICELSKQSENHKSFSEKFRCISILFHLLAVIYGLTSFARLAFSLLFLIWKLILKLYTMYISLYYSFHHHWSDNCCWVVLYYFVHMWVVRREIKGSTTEPCGTPVINSLIRCCVDWSDIYYLNSIIKIGAEPPLSCTINLV